MKVAETDMFLTTIGTIAELITEFGKIGVVWDGVTPDFQCPHFDFNWIGSIEGETGLQFIIRINSGKADKAAYKSLIKAMKKVSDKNPAVPYREFS